MASHEWTVNLPDGTEYVIESERDLTPDELNAEIGNLTRQHSDTYQPVAASAANAAGRGFIGGAGGLVEGVGDLASLVIGDNPIQNAGRGIKDYGNESFPVNPANEDRFAVKAGQVVGGAAEQVLEFATGAKVLGTLGMAGRAGQLATGSMFAKGADSGQDMAAQYGVEDDPWRKAAFTLGGGLIEAGTERLGGFAAEGALARRLGILPEGQGGMSGFIGGVATEGGEEVAANTANNTMANVLVSPEQAAAAGQRLPGYFEGNLEAGALGMVGGAAMGLPMIGSQQAQPTQLPPPAGFTGPATPSPAAPGIPGRASAVATPAPVARAGVSEEELAAMEVPQQRIATVAAAIAAAPDPATEKAVLETAAVAARIQAANPNPAPVLEQAPAVVQKPKPQRPSRRFSADPSTYPLVTAIVEAGISPRNPAAALARARTNRRESLTPQQQTIMQAAGGYDDLPTVKEFAGRPRAQDAIRKMFRNGSQNTPDVALQQAATFAGRDSQDFYGNTAWQEIRAELMKLDDDARAADAEDERMNAMEKQAVEFYAAIEEGPFRVDISSLERDDVLIIEGEEVKVKAINRDENGDVQSVELLDGPKFGRQEIDGTTALFVEEFQEDTSNSDNPEVQPASGEMQASSPALPSEPRSTPQSPNSITPAPEVTADGQRDMLAGREDEPFNLTAESAEERAKREARELNEQNAAQRREAAAARAAAEQAQTTMPFSRSDAVVPPPANPLPAATVADRLRQRTASADKISLVTDPTLPWEGRLQPNGLIELNTARLATIEDVDRVFDHEVAHLAERDPSLRRTIAAMRAAMPADFIAEMEADLRRRGYGNSALPSEVTANLAQRLGQEFRNQPAWRQLLSRIQTWAKETLGMTLNDRDAEVLAARILARGMTALDASTATAGGDSYSLPSPPDAPGLFEKFFGADKKVVEDVKETEARNATRRALEVPLLAGIIDGHTPGQPLEETLAAMTDDQRSALHDRIITDFSRITGTDEEARAYRNELVAYMESLPEFAGQRNVSTVGLQYTNMVQAAAALSGIYGRTGAFALIVGTDNDQIKFDAGDVVLTRSDDGRRLGSQSGIGGRIAEFASIMSASHNDALKRMGFTDATIMEMQSALADRALTANEIEDIFASATTSPEGPGITTALIKLQRLADAAATTAMEFWKEAIDLKPERMAKSILSDAVGPLVGKLPVDRIVKTFMAAPAIHRNSTSWRTLQISNWLAEQGIDEAMAVKLAVSMDEMVARVLANVTFQEQEKYLTRKKSIGPSADLPAFAAKYRENRDAIREAIRMGLLTDGTPWQAWFSSVTGVPALTAAEQVKMASWETIVSGDEYYPSEKGVASAELRDFMTRKFGKDPSGWELLASSYDGSALSAGSTGAIQITAPVGRMMGVIAQDMAFSILSLSRTKAADVVGNFMKAVDVYIAELPVAFKYDTAGNVGANEAQNLNAMAPMRRDLEIQSKRILDKSASPQSRILAAARWFRSAQDFLRRGMNAADSASINMFQRYFESREIQQFMRTQKISKQDVKVAYKASGFTMETAGLMADALGYEGSLRKRFINDAMWDHWKKIATASKLDPEKRETYLKELLENSEREAEFQIFSGGLRDRGAVTDPIDGIINITQRIGEGIFRAARERVEEGQVFQGSAARLAARMVLGFVGIPLNASRAALWYTPLSIVSWINYAAWKAGKFKSNPYERSLGNAISVHQRMREGVVGTTILLLGAALLKSLADGDDDEGEWKIHGEGPDYSKHPDEAMSWRRTHVKHSIERKNPDGSITTIPFSKGTLEYLKAPLMLLAGISDAQRNARLDGEREPKTSEIFQSMLTQLGMASMSQGVRNATDFRKTVERGTKWEAVQSQSAFMLSPFLPWSGAERWIRTWNHPEQLEAGFWSRMPFAHYREDARPALNTFGQNLQADPTSTQLASRQFAGFPMVYTRTLSPEDRKVYGWIEKTSLRPTSYSRPEVEKRVTQSLTDEQWYEYTKASGQVRYNQLLQALDGTLKIDRTGDKKTALVPMRKGLADIDVKDPQAMVEAGNILEDIGAAAHAAGLKAINAVEPEKAKVVKKKTTVY